MPEDHSPAELMGNAGAVTGAPALLARAHHGSVSKEQRSQVEEDLKAGRLPAVVATSSLELGIDMGAVDLVIQVESPPSVASGLQRVGRAGHQVGAVSAGVVFPKYRGDLVQSAVVTERMREGAIEALRIPANPLDVLAQQIVAMAAVDTWNVDELLVLVRRAAPFAALPESAYTSVLDMLAGRYPSDAFAELRPRLVWDRVAGTLSGRPGAQRLAVTSGGTIPDRGLFGVFLAGADPKKGGGRVGELDEEMVYESRVGDVFTLGTTTWRIEDITRDRVLVTPAPGVPGRLPFWRGDQLGRPLELGRALGAFLREIGSLSREQAEQRLAASGMDALAIGNLLAYLGEQREAAGHVPDDRTIVVERFRDELGDWRIVVHSPFGAQVHAPWALAIGARLTERYGMDAQVMHADDGLVLRLPDAELMDLDLFEGEARPPRTPPQEAPSDLDEPPLGVGDVLFDRGEVEQTVTDQVGNSALFAARFRECASRALLLLPRRSPGKRTPLWQQRQRASQLLQVAAEFGSFPIVLEAVRECLQDVFDVPGLTELMGDIEARRVRVVEVTTPEPSPFARSLLFGYVAQYLYGGGLAAGRAAGRRALPGLAAAVGAAGPGGTAGAAGRRRAGGAGAGTPVAYRGPPPQGRGGRGPTCCGCWVRSPRTSWRSAVPSRAGRQSWRRPAAPSGSGSRAGTTGRRSRTRGGCGTRSGWRCPSGFPKPSPSRWRTRWVTCSRASPARTARSPPPRRRTASDSGPLSRTVRCTGWRPAGGWSRASSTPRESARSGARRGGAAQAAAPLAGRAAPGVGAGRPAVAGRPSAAVAACAHQQPAGGGGAAALGGAVARGARSGVRVGEAGAARQGRGLCAAHAGRADRLGRGRLGGCRGAARQGRLDLTPVGRRRPAAAAFPASAGAHSGAPGGAVRVGRGLRAVLPADRRARAGRASGVDRPAAHRGAVGSRVVGQGHR